MNPAHEHQVNKRTIQMVQISIRYFIMYHLICIIMTGKSRNKINLHFQSFNAVAFVFNERSFSPSIYYSLVTI